MPPRKPANIPLHTLSHSHHKLASSSDSASEDEKPLREHRESNDSNDADSDASDFSLWSDTGDLVDQLADEDDPLRTKERPSTEADPNGHLARKRIKHKKVRYQIEDEELAIHDEKGARPSAAVPRRKEDIQIPAPGRKPLPIGGKILALLLAPTNARARSQGVYGKRLVYFTTVFISMGVFLFGYDQGVMSGIITGPYFEDYFHHPPHSEIATMVAILEIGALISSLGVGKIGDVIGRRRTIFWGAVVFLIGGALQTFATGMPMMMVGRIIAGFGVGALSTIVPVFQSEISPPHNRGKLACIEWTGNISGYAASVWVDYGSSFLDNNWSWRIPLLMQCIMGAFLCVGSLVIAETPRWLLDNDHDDEGIVVISNLYGEGDIHSPRTRDEYREIKMNVFQQRQEGERSYMEMFRRYSRRVLIAMSSQALAQLNGINVISYYAPLVFESAGWVGRGAILMTGINALTYLASTIPPWYLVDRWGRRFILLTGAITMIISLSGISFWIWVDVKATPTLTVISVMVYNAAFGASWGPIPWLYPPEILPLSIRAKGASLSTAANWAFNWLVGEGTPILQDAIQWRLYLVHAGFCALSFVVVYFIYPETANVRLEDMNALFGDEAPEMPPMTETPAFLTRQSPATSLQVDRRPRSIENAPLNPLNVQSPNPDADASKEGMRPTPTRSGSAFGNFFSGMFHRARGSRSKEDIDGGGGGSSSYKPVGQNDD